jgi:hypothetical protein
MQQKNSRRERRARAVAKLNNACISRCYEDSVQVFGALTEFL